MIESLRHSFACMGTVVTLHVVGHSETPELAEQRDAAIVRAQQWFVHIETSCNRFNAASEVRKLSENIGEPVPVSELLLQAVSFAIAVAKETDGAFDPTVGKRMEERGFNRAYETGEVSQSVLNYTAKVSYRDVEIDATERTITLHAPLLLDLGAVAKGLAIDVAARELQPLHNFEIDAGGDVYVAGQSPRGEAWRVGIRHPREPDSLISTLRVSNLAVCTSGDYERKSDVDGGHHIMNATTGESANALASVTVTAPSAMVADALATAAFALGPKAGMALIKRHNLDALFITPTLERFATKGLPVV